MRFLAMAVCWKRCDIPHAATEQGGVCEACSTSMLVMHAIYALRNLIKAKSKPTYDTGYQIPRGAHVRRPQTEYSADSAALLAV